MANYKGTINHGNWSYTGKQSLLPPKSPFPSIAPGFADYGSGPSTGSKGVPKPREGHRQHQRTSSESFLIDEQPSWLDDLLNEPETPVRRGAHRRSSSDSFAYVEACSRFSNIDNLAQEYKNIASVPSWGSQDFDQFKDEWNASFYTEANSLGRQLNNRWESSLNSITYPSTLPFVSDSILLASSGPSCARRDLDGAITAAITAATERQVQEGPDSSDLKGSSEKRDCRAKPSASDTDPKRAKQQFAQRSRVRKLQYIAELERNVQALQADESEVSAELEFLDRQHLVLSLENKALKQRVENMAHEQVIKYMEQDVLEREIARLRAMLYQQQQQLPPTTSSSGGRDLDSQFANLSLKHREANSGRGTLHT